LTCDGLAACSFARARCGFKPLPDTLSRFF
jgi:hypothetical protein